MTIMFDVCASVTDQESASRPAVALLSKRIFESRTRAGPMAILHPKGLRLSKELLRYL